MNNIGLEKIFEQKRIGEGRRKLLELEKEGKYVFHGSPDVIDALEPRQAGGHNEETGEWEDDRSPAVYATPYADLAIFRSLITDKDFENNFGIDGDKLSMVAGKELIERAKAKTGRVYVLDKSKFDPNSFIGIECRSEERIMPIQVIEVVVDDLPDNIKIVQ